MLFGPLSDVRFLFTSVHICGTTARARLTSTTNKQTATTTKHRTNRNPVHTGWPCARAATQPHARNGTHARSVSCCGLTCCRCAAFSILSSEQWRRGTGKHRDLLFTQHAGVVRAAQAMITRICPPGRPAVCAHGAHFSPFISCFAN